jgi:signal transduction histidine kinase
MPLETQLSKSVILIIDDNPTNIKVVVDYLKEQGVQTIIARDGDMGIKRAKFSKPDLILLDILMPGIDGFETCRRLKADKETNEIPIIFMTALSSVDDKIKGFGVGGVDYITKPVEGNEMLARVRTHLKLCTQHKQLQHQAIALKQAKEFAETAQAAAEQANRSKSAFLANMSHELRTPLNAIIGFSRIMSRSKALSNENQEYSDIILHSGEHLLTLINQVLDLSKVEAGKITVNTKSFDLYRMLQTIEDMFTLKAADQHLQLIFDTDATVPQYIQTDETKLRQVIINLLNNALKFTREGRVSVRITRGRKDGNKAGSAVLNFEVEDSGPGIPQENRESIFEAFSQTQLGMDAQEGTGLGLPISRKFIRLLGGDITVGGEMGRGSIFRFSINVETINAAQITPDLSNRTVTGLKPGQPQLRVLVVDDRKINRRLLKELLTPLKFELKEATCGEEALTLSLEWLPHLILLDIQSGSDDETVKKIKESHEGQCCLIGMSATSFDKEDEKALAAGCNDFLRKPFKESELFGLMKKHLGLQYCYEEQQSMQQKPKKQEKITLTPQRLASLPQELNGALKRAVSIVDFDASMEVLSKIKDNDELLAEAIEELVRNYRFDTLQGLFEEK